MLKQCVASVLTITLFAGTAFGQVNVRIHQNHVGTPVVVVRPNQRVSSPIHRQVPPRQVLPSRVLSAHEPSVANHQRVSSPAATAHTQRLATLQEQARSGNPGAAYALGHDAEYGYAPERQSPNIPQAVGWYNQAVAGGNLQAMYHLGSLMKSQRVYAADSSGGMHPDPAAGNRMMQYALDHGYNPVTDSVQTPPAKSPVNPSIPGHLSTSASSSDGSSGSDVLAGGLALIVAFGILASMSSNSGSSTQSDDGDTRMCTIHIQNPQGGLGYAPGTLALPGYGSQCDQPNAW